LTALYTQKHSIIHTTDARVQVIFTLAFVLCLSLSPFGAWPAYILYLALVLSAALLARLSPVFLFKRALIALPFVLAAVPLLFFGPPPLSTIHFLPGLQVPYSPAGLWRFLSIALKSWIAVQAAIVLSATTRFPDLLLAFRRLRVPALFIAIVGLMWRYLFVIRDEVVRMLRARTSRSTAAPGSLKSGSSVLWRARVTGGMAGSLFLRSLERSERVYAAMLARGYSGELPGAASKPFSPREWGILTAGTGVLALVWLLSLLTGG